MVRYAKLSLLMENDLEINDCQLWRVNQLRRIYNRIYWVIVACVRCIYLYEYIYLLLSFT